MKFTSSAQNGSAIPAWQELNRNTMAMPPLCHHNFLLCRRLLSKQGHHTGETRRFHQLPGAIRKRHLGKPPNVDFCLALCEMLRPFKGGSDATLLASGCVFTGRLGSAVEKTFKTGSKPCGLR